MPAYDSDFSEASLAPPSDSDYQSEEEPEIGWAEQSRLKALVPPFCRLKPKLPIGRWVWHCLGPNCRYQINMLKLTAENLKGLSSKMTEWLRLGEWDLGHPLTQAGWRQMIEMHYDEHMRVAGVELYQRVDAAGKATPHVRAWPPRRVTGRNVEEKEEEAGTSKDKDKGKADGNEGDEGKAKQN